MFKEFYPLLEQFLCIYLPKQKGCSEHTIMSYYTAVCQFVIWLSNTADIKKSKISVFDFSKEQVLCWLSSIEDNGCSVSTRNQRLAGIRSFLSFAAEEEPVYMDICLLVGKIRIKKGPKSTKDFLSIEELQAIIRSIPSNDSVTVRHYVLLSTLYDSAVRVQEISQMKAADISYGKNCSIRIFGKGRKTRIVYISSSAASLLKGYCQRFAISEGYLFRNRYGQPLTDSGIDYIIKKYVSIASAYMPSLKSKKVSAHTFRRTKATHMLLNGVGLPVIQRFLGHESIQTTEEYLEIGSEAMTNAVNQTVTSLFTKNKLTEAEKWKDIDIMEQLRQKISIR
jgi:site-specific recombinase XerD